MKFLSLIFIAASYLLISSAQATTPCDEDSACLAAADTHFENPNHYVFIGAYPGDELLFYPFMKDHCAETSSYCAMIMATRGKSDCEFSSGETCGDIRTTELQMSAEYLNADLWHHDLPGSNEILPDMLAQTRNVYTQIARDSGFAKLSDYFKYIFGKLQSSSGSPLVVISLQPHYGSINHPEDNVIYVLDDAITDAVEDLQRAGVQIAHIYTHSKQHGSQPVFIDKQNDASLECRSGSASLRSTHTDLTSYNVFEYGYHHIYQSQTFHAGELHPDPSLYTFCFGHTNHYFDTARRDKFFGLLLTESAQLNEVDRFSNAFSFAPAQPSEITDYLNKNLNNLLPVIEIGRFFFDTTRHVFAHSPVIVDAIVQAVRTASYRGPMLFLIDEPLWHIRIPCLTGVTTACHEIDTGYANTQAAFRKIGQDLRKALPEAGMLHIEAYAELLLQKLDYPYRDVILLDDAEYLGYDCYGPFDSCGPKDISAVFPENLGVTNVTNTFNISAASLNHHFDRPTLYKITDQNVGAVFTQAAIQPDIPAGGELGLLCNRNDHRCAPIGLPAGTGPVSQMTYINWVSNTIQSLEAQHPLGRKILLVPGAFQDFNAFPAEPMAIAQLDAFTQLLDSSAIFAGMGGFIWGNLQEGFLPHIGARSLSSVRNAIKQTFNDRMSRPKTVDIDDAHAHSMSLVGAVGARGYFDQVVVNGATQGDIYFQSTGMDSCSLNIGDEPGRMLKLDQLDHVHIPNLVAPLDVEAICSQKEQIFTKKVRFVN